jgi:serine/threonine protein kinase
VNQKSTAPVQVGEVLAGKYRVERIIGTGGMGVVVEAMHIDLGQRVALKFMLPDAAANDAAVERFSREARASASLQSDNVVHVTDIGALESGEPFMVMEYLEGEDLGHILKTLGPLTSDDAVDYVLQACAGLAEAHASGIIHRDLKPANLFLAHRVDTASVVKIVDFGISKVNVAGVVGKLTDTRDLMGSPLYMSPEQLASSRDVDARTDIWSLGIILYELLAGVAPFDGDTLPQLCSAVLIAPAPPVLEKRPDLPAGLADVVAKCLEKKPGDRYASVVELADALAEFAPPRSSVTLERISRLAGNSPPPPERAPTPSQRPHLELVVQPMANTSSTWTPDETLPPIPKSSTRAWLAVTLVALLVGSGGVFAFGHRAVILRSLGSSPGAPAVVVTPPSAPVTAATPSTISSATPSAIVSATPPEPIVVPTAAAASTSRRPVLPPHTSLASRPAATSATSASLPVPKTPGAPASGWALTRTGSTHPAPSAAPTAIPGPYDE